MTAGEFQSKFTNLQGTTIGERKKYLFVHLSSLTKEEKDSIDFSQLETSTPLEEKLKVDILIQLFRVDELFELFKSENLNFFDKILRLESAFIIRAFENVSGEQLVDVVFPSICLKAKLKLLNKLAECIKNEKRADEYFEAIVQKYGLYLASKLISACSADLILRNIDLHRIKLTARQLLNIYKKHPNIFLKILDFMHKYDVDFGDQYKCVFLHLARKNVALFLELRQTYNLSITLGRRITDKFVRKTKTEIIAKPKIYFTIFHNKQIVKSLGSDISSLLLNYYPPDVENAYYSLKQILSIIPKREHPESLFMTLFEKSYRISAWENPEFVPIELLRKLPVEERASKLQLDNKPKDVYEEKWYSLFKLDISIPYLKKRIMLTSDIKLRSSLVGCLVETCKNNQDQVALAEVCKYVLNKHRNDNIAVRGKFLKVLEEEFNLRELDENHWSSINELIKIFKMNNEYFYQDDEYFQAYVYFCLKNGISIKEPLTELMKSRMGFLQLFSDTPKFEKQCLLLSYEVTKNIFQNDEYRLIRYNVEYLEAVAKWNNKHPDDVLDIFSFSQSFFLIKEYMKQNEYKFSTNKIVKYCLVNYYDHEETQSLLKVYIQQEARYIDIDILVWLTKHKPKYIRENLVQLTHVAIVKTVWENNYYFWILCKNYSHLELPQKMIPICIEKYKTDEGAVAGLSILMTSSDYLQLIPSYYPVSLKADPQTEEGRNLYTTQQTLCKFLNLLHPASSAWDCIFEFSKGDYLKLIQRALYSTSDTTNENKLLPTLMKFTESAVSVRKHAMHLAFRLLDKKDIFKILGQFIEKEKNSSIRKYLFKGSFHHFLKNPDDELWQLAKLNLEHVDVDDQEAIEILMNTSKIPKLYKSKYIIFVWDFLNRHQKANKSWCSEKCALLQMATAEIVPQLPKHFCESIIEENFFKNEDIIITPYVSKIYAFTCRYIIYGDPVSEQETRLKRYLAVIKDYLNYPRNNYLATNSCLNCVGSFVDKFCLLFLENHCTHMSLLIKFSVIWNDLVKPHTAFKKYLLVQFTLIYTEHLSLTQISERLVALYDSLVLIYGVLIAGEFAEQLKHFERYFLSESDFEKEHLNLCEDMMKSEGPVPLCRMFLVAAMFADNAPQIVEYRIKYDSMVEAMYQQSDSAFQMYLNITLSE